MPELPEVEITRRQLAPSLLGRTICKVQTTAPSYFFATPPATLRRRLIGLQTVELLRHGKYLLLTLSNGSRLLLHLGMTGHLFFSNQFESIERSHPVHPMRDASSDPHVHLRMHLGGVDTPLYFRDVRKFGKVKLLLPGSHEDRIDKLGPDALEGSIREIVARIATRKAPIKAVLLDQTTIAGVGNIYADEALFRSKIHPLLTANSLKPARAKALAIAMQQILKKAIENGGSTIRDFKTPEGASGSYQQRHAVYARTGLACQECGQSIVRIRVRQRSTHYCPSCQRG